MNTRYSPRLEQSGNTPIDPEFERLFETVGNHVADIAEFLEVPPIEVTAVVADDFCGEVERAAAMSEAAEEYGDGKYHVERLGAVVVAQTTRLAQTGRGVASSSTVRGCSWRTTHLRR